MLLEEERKYAFVLAYQTKPAEGERSQINKAILQILQLSPGLAHKSNS